jgi:hypothetical protein
MTSGSEEAADAAETHIQKSSNVGVTKQKRLNNSRAAARGDVAANDRVPPAPSARQSQPTSEEMLRPVGAPVSEPTDSQKQPTQNEPESDSIPVDAKASGAQTKAKVATAARPRPKSVLELIEAAYGATSKFTLTAADIDELQGSLTAGQSLNLERERTLELASKDHSLKGLVNLLSPIALHATKKGPLRDQVSELSLVALWQHPMLTKRLGMPRTAGGLPDINAKRIWEIASEFAKEPDKAGSRNKTLRANAVTAFALLGVMRDGWTLDELTVALGETLWSSQPESSARTIAASAILIGAGDYDLPTRLGVLHHGAALAAREADRLLSAATAASNSWSRRASIAEARVNELEATVAALEVDLSSSREEITRTDDELQRAREDGSVARSHHAEDYEVLRTQILRQLSKQADLLTDGLHALRNGSHGIAEEFVDRALTAISREVSNLKDKGDMK